MLKVDCYGRAIAENGFTGAIHEQQTFLVPFAIGAVELNKGSHPPAGYRFGEIIPVLFRESVFPQLKPDVTHNATGAIAELLKAQSYQSSSQTQRVRCFAKLRTSMPWCRYEDAGNTVKTN